MKLQCPHCQNEQDPTNEIGCVVDTFFQGEDFETECSECKKMFYWTVDKVEITLSSYK